MRRLHILVLAAMAAALCLAFPTAAFAEHLSGGDGWLVTYTKDGKMSDNYSSEQYIDKIGELQPGDDITFTVSLKHENDKDADWYLSNDVVKSLEAGKAEGSAYGYLLTYTGPGQSRTLYDSSAVGGDDTEGLKEATNAMEEFLYLDKLSKGQSGTVKLLVTLDGETEGNDYFNTLARLNMRFAVEASDPTKTTPPPTKTTTPPPVKTGDETDLFPFYVIMTVSGLLLLVIAIMSVRNRKREREAQGAHTR